MPVNASFAGRTYPPTAPYAVGREKIREFAEAVGATDPVHTDRDVARARGYRDVIATPTFAVLVAQQCDKQLIADPEAGIDYSRVVHGEQRFVHHRPITAGDEIVGVLHRRRRARGRRPRHGHHPQRAGHRGRRAGLHRHVDDRHQGRGVT